MFLDQNYSVVAYCEFVVQENRLFFTVIEDIKYSSKRRQKNEKWIFFPFMFPTHKKPEWHVWKTLSWYQFCLLTLLIRLVRDLPRFTKNEQNRFDRAEIWPLHGLGEIESNFGLPPPSQKFQDPHMAKKPEVIQTSLSLASFFFSTVTITTPLTN